MLAYGEHEGGVEDGAVGADEAGELAVGELPEGIRRRGRRGRRGGQQEVVEAPLPLLRVTRPAVAAEHAHAGFLAVAATAAGRRSGGLVVVWPAPSPWTGPGFPPCQTLLLLGLFWWGHWGANCEGWWVCQWADLMIEWALCLASYDLSLRCILWKKSTLGPSTFAKV